MLVITRKSGESLLIGDGIEVRILDISPVRVKLGIVAPADVSVLRNEVLLTRQANLAAARPTPGEQLAALAAGLRNASPPTRSEDFDKSL